MIWGSPRAQYPGFSTVGIWDYVAPKKRDFGTSIPKRHILTITHYLQYKTFVFMVPRPPKYQYFGTPKAAKQ